MQAAVSIALAAISVPTSVVPINKYDVQVLKASDRSVVSGTVLFVESVSPLACSFDLPGGEFVVVASRMDSNNQPIGTPAESQPFTVTSSHDVVVPASVTVTLG
jgi:hypothetical protein